MKLTELDLFHLGLVTGRGNWVACSPRKIFYRTKILLKEKILADLVIVNMRTTLQNIHPKEWL
jgi:hypothetical protein